VAYQLISKMFSIVAPLAKELLIRIQILVAATGLPQFEEVRENPPPPPNKFLKKFAVFLGEHFASSRRHI
jgi:hypothetical protein